MKALVKLFAAAAIVAGMTACSGSDSPLSASSAKKALKKEAMFAKDSQVRKFEVGFQEVSEGYLQGLAALKQAGVIDYTTETAVEKKRSREWVNYFVGYQYRTVEVLHVFANVTLTDAGRKFVVEHPTEVRADLLDELKANEGYEETVPEYMSASDNTFTANATAGQIVEEEPTDLDTMTEEDIAETVEEVQEAVEQAKAPAGKADPNAAYKAMLDRVSTETVNVLLGRYEIVKVKEVLCTEEMFKEGRGSCKVFFKFVEKTPFGYVLGAPENDKVSHGSAKFCLYQDLGWTVTD